MITLARTMLEVFKNSKTEGAYMLLFVLSIVILYVTGRDRNKFHVIFPVILIFGVVCNPITVWILSRFFPVVGFYEPMTALIPILTYIPFGIIELLDGIKSVRTKRILAAVLFLFVAICGNFFGLFSGNTKTGANLYDGDKQRLVAYLEQNADGPVLADEGIMPFITAYGDNVPLIYAHDIMMTNGDLGIMDGYDEELVRLHDMMWEPEKYMPDIAQVANKRGCDIIVVKSFDGAERAEGPYRCVEDNGDYIIYRRVG